MALLDDKIIELGRIAMLRESLGEFARKELVHDGHIIVEATGTPQPSSKCVHFTSTAS